MTKRRMPWVNSVVGVPRIEGTLEISKSKEGIFIGGDPCALRSLAKLLIYIANVDQEKLRTQPDGSRFHAHLHARDVEGFNSLTQFSEETELCRLDAKGTGELPEKYRKLDKLVAARMKKASNRRMDTETMRLVENRKVVTNEQNRRRKKPSSE